MNPTWHFNLRARGSLRLSCIGVASFWLLLCLCVTTHYLSLTLTTYHYGVISQSLNYASFGFYSFGHFVLFPTTLTSCSFQLHLTSCSCHCVYSLGPLAWGCPLALLVTNLSKPHTRNMSFACVFGFRTQVSGAALTQIDAQSELPFRRCACRCCVCVVSSFGAPCVLCVTFCVLDAPYFCVWCVCAVCVSVCVV